MEKKTVLILVGIPGAGKTTYAKKIVGEETKDGNIWLNADSIRKELYGDESVQGDGRKVFGLLYDRFAWALKNDTIHTIVVDNTSVSYKRRADIYVVIAESGVECKTILVVFDDHKLAKERNKKRARIVPEDVMDRMEQNFQKPSKEEIKQANISQVINPYK